MRLAAGGRSIAPTPRCGPPLLPVGELPPGRPGAAPELPESAPRLAPPTNGRSVDMKGQLRRRRPGRPDRLPGNLGQPGRRFPGRTREPGQLPLLRHRRHRPGRRLAGAPAPAWPGRGDDGGGAGAGGRQCLRHRHRVCAGGGDQSGARGDVGCLRLAVPAGRSTDSQGANLTWPGGPHWTRLLRPGPVAGWPHSGIS